MQVTGFAVSVRYYIKVYNVRCVMLTFDSMSELGNAIFIGLWKKTETYSIRNGLKHKSGIRKWSIPTWNTAHSEKHCVTSHEFLDNLYSERVPHS